MAPTLGLPRPRRGRLSGRPARWAGARGRRAPAWLILLLAPAGIAVAQAPPDASDLTVEFETGLGREVHVEAGARVRQDLLAMGATLTVDGEAEGDAVAIDGDLLVRGRVAGDALAIGGRVRLARGARVDGNAFSLFGGVDVAEGASVGGRVRSLAPVPPGREPTYLDVAFARPVLLGRFLVLVFWILAALAGAFAAPITVAQSAAETLRRPLRLAGIGLLLSLSLALSVVLSVALIPLFVGIPLLVLLVLAWLGLAAVSFASSFHALGERLFDRLGAGTVSGYVQVLVGALAFGVLHFVPIVGELAWTAAYLAGAGGALATRMGRRGARSSAALG
jgi:hypothetical protein